MHLGHFCANIICTYVHNRTVIRTFPSSQIFRRPLFRSLLPYFPSFLLPFFFSALLSFFAFSYPIFCLSTSLLLFFLNFPPCLLFFPSLTLFSQAFEIMPLTFQLPHEYTHFVKAFMEAEQNIKEKDESNSQNFWIMKPVGMSRGRYVRSFTLHPFSFPTSLKKNCQFFVIFLIFITHSICFIHILDLIIF